MYGTPWHGDAPYSSPRGVRLEGIFFSETRPDRDTLYAKGRQAVAEIPFRLSKPFLINLRLAPGDVKTRPEGF